MRNVSAAILLCQLLGIAVSQQEIHVRSYRALQITPGRRVTANPAAATPTEAPTSFPTVSSGHAPSVAPVQGHSGNVSPTAGGTNSSNTTSVLRCGCMTCNDTVWNNKTGNSNFTCGDRIEYVVQQGSTQTAACILVAKQFPESCSGCDPLTCPPIRDGNATQNATATPSATPTMSPTPVQGRAGNGSSTASPMPTAGGTNMSATTLCGCATCNATAWNNRTGNTEITCRDRIEFVVRQGSTEVAACALVAQQFTESCSGCNPLTCVRIGSDLGGNATQNITTAPGTNATGSSGNGTATNTTAGGGQNTTAGGGQNVTAPGGGYFCECPTCTWSVLSNTTEGNVTCADRLAYLLSLGTNDTQACFVISDQFSNECGACNPYNCSSPAGSRTAAPGNGTTAGNGTSQSPTQSPTGAPTAVPSAAPTTSPTTPPTAVPTAIPVSTLEPTAGFTERTSRPVQGGSTSMAASYAKASVLCAASMVMLFGLFV